MGDGLFGLLGFLNQLLYKAYHEMANTQRENCLFPRKTGQVKQGAIWVRRVMAIDDGPSQNLSSWA
jgi:hypothetical protein